MDRSQQHATHDVAPQKHRNCQPIDPLSGDPIPPRPQVGYYPGYETLSQQSFWDEATRTVVLKRVHEESNLRFFTPAEAPLMQAIIDRILPQDDRDDAHKIPILPVIDERLATNRIDGYRFADMPPDTEAHRLGMQAIDAIAQHLFTQPFITITPPQQEQVLRTIHDGKPPAGQAIWQRMSVQRYWELLVQDCVEAYYAHPYAWDEIGFGGPAYPRGYMRLRNGQPEPWEKDEVRYPWRAPSWSVSQDFTPLGGEHETLSPGQAGTH